MRITAGFLLLSAALTLAPPLRAADPTATDCFAANEKSIELRSASKLREARTQLALCQSQGCPADVRTVCERRLDQVNVAIPTMIFDVKDIAGNDVAGVKVTMDGEPLSDWLDGTAISLDPGDHKFVFSVAGQPPVEKTFVLKQTEKNRRERIVLGDASEPTPAPPMAPAPPPVSSPASAMEPARASEGARPTASSWSTPKTWAIVSAGVGVVGIGLGAAFGFVASSQWSKAQSDCRNACGPTSNAQNEKSDANTSANVSNVGFALGAAGVVAGAVLWFTAPKSAESAPAGAGVQMIPVIGPSGGGWMVKGAFW